MSRERGPTMTRLKRAWQNLRGSFWFMPGVIVVVSIVLAVGLVESQTDGRDEWLARWPRLFGPAPTPHAGCCRRSRAP